MSLKFPFSSTFFGAEALKISAPSEPSVMDIADLCAANQRPAMMHDSSDDEAASDRGAPRPFSDHGQVADVRIVTPFGGSRIRRLGWEVECQSSHMLMTQLSRALVHMRIDFERIPVRASASSSRMRPPHDAWWLLSSSADARVRLSCLARAPCRRRGSSHAR